MNILAVDNQISTKVVEKLERFYKVAIWAGDKSDEEWVEEGLNLGANIFISPDLDIPNLIDRLAPDEGIIWIDIPQGMARDKQFNYIVSQIKKVG